MADLFATGRIIDLILALVAVEAIFLAIVWRRTGRGIAIADLMSSLAPGVALLFALKVQAAGPDWTRTAAWLAVALVAHLADVARRWKR